MAELLKTVKEQAARYSKTCRCKSVISPWYLEMHDQFKQMQKSVACERCSHLIFYVCLKVEFANLCRGVIFVLYNI